MKPINEMTLAECLDFLRNMIWLDVTRENHIPYLDRIHELTRWIPVDERLPTKEDGDEKGFVLYKEVERESSHRIYHTLGKWNLFESPDDYPDYFYKVISWKRINPPEDV